MRAQSGAYWRATRRRAGARSLVLLRALGLVALAAAMVFTGSSDAAVQAGGDGAAGFGAVDLEPQSGAVAPGRAEPDGEGADPPAIFLDVPAGADAALSAELRARGFEIVQVFPEIDTIVVRVADKTSSAVVGAEDPEGAASQPDLAGPSINSTLESLADIPGVESAEVGHDKYACLVPNDPHYAFMSSGTPGQWGMRRVGLERVWDRVTGHPSVTVAVLDSGLATDIADFGGRIVSPYSTLNRSAASWAWDDVFGHGSGVTGVAAAAGNNGYGIAGTAWGILVMPVHFTNDGRVDSEHYVAAIYHAVDQGADVINISYGSVGTFDAERRAIQHALDNGVVVVAAAGNRGVGQGIDYPARLPGVIAVGATDSLDRRAAFSCTGPDLDLMAPGVNVLTYTASATTYSLAYTQGTSFSSPMVAGVASLMLSVNPKLTPAQVEQFLRQSADDLGPSGFDEQFGYGVLNAEAAVALAEASVGPTTTTTASSTTTTTVLLPTTTTTTTLPPTTTTTLPSTTTTTIPPRTFSDVPEGALYSVAILGLAREGVVEGYTDGTFRPFEPVWRAQFAKMVCGLMNVPVHAGLVPPFGDLGEDNTGSLYPHQFVAAAAHAGITFGTAPGRFSPYRELSRTQAVTMIVRGAQELFPGLLAVPPPEYRGSLGNFDATHGSNMRIAEYNGLLVGLQGYGPGWDPWSSTDRGDVAQMMWQFWLLRL